MQSCDETEGNRINSGKEENAAGIPHRVWKQDYRLAVSIRSSSLLRFSNINHTVTVLFIYYDFYVLPFFKLISVTIYFACK